MNSISRKPDPKSKILVAIIIFLLAVLGAIATKEGYWQTAKRLAAGHPTRLIESPDYQALLSVHRRQLSQASGRSDVQIAFIGDSIIEGWLTSAFAATSINLGIGRDTIPAIVARTDADFFQHIPTWYLGIGINNALNGDHPDEIAGYVEQISRLFGGADQLIWRAALPVERPGWRAEQEEFRQHLNARAQEACNAMPNCTFLGAPEGYSDNISTWTSDGLHPNALGYRALTDQLCAVVICLSDTP